MKKVLPIIIILTIFLSTNLFSVEAIKLQTSRVNITQTWTVDNEGDGDFKSIYKAINKAKPGDIIKVYSGIYKEHIKLNKQVTLIGISSELGEGDDSGKPVIDGCGCGDVLTVETDGCKVSGFKVTKSAMKFFMGTGIKITSDNCYVQENTLENNFIGISLSNGENCSITDNTLLYNIFGVHTIHPINCEISNNSFYNSGLTIVATAAEVVSNTIKNNTVNDKNFSMYIWINDTILSDSDAGQILLIDCHNLTIQNLDISDTSIGVIIQDSSDLHICNNRFENIHRGAISLQGKNCEIDNNTFYNCSYGCYLEGGENFYLHHNNFIKVFKHDQPCISWVKKHQTFMESKDITFDRNYWDDWVGLKGSIFRLIPKVIPGFRKYWHKMLNILPVFEFDMHPALKPY